MNWIETKKELPQGGDYVLIFGSMGIEVAKLWNEDLWRAGNEFRRREFTTHWMPLPDEPKDTETGDSGGS